MTHAAGPATAVAGHVLGGRYVLERPLAAGGMGQVWIARHAALERLVAVKLMTAETHASDVLRLRFEREARACAQLRSPHVVQVFDYGVDGDVPFLVMELLEGEDLAALQRERHRWPLAEVSSVLTQAARGLREAHELGIVHRDIKLSNLFMARVGGDSVVKVLDFGVARVFESTGRKVTALDVQVGTTSYMSPEQLVTHEVDSRADVWSLAVVAFRLLTGMPLFEGDTPMTVAQNIVGHRRRRVVDCVRDLPVELERIFDKAFAPSIGDRFQSAEELASAFESVARAGAPAAPPSSPAAVVVPARDALHFEPTAMAPVLLVEPATTAHPGTPVPLSDGPTAVASTLTLGVRQPAPTGPAWGAGAPPRRSSAALWVGSLVVVFVLLAAVAGAAFVARAPKSANAPATSREARVEPPRAEPAALPAAVDPAPGAAEPSAAPQPIASSSTSAPGVPSGTASAASAQPRPNPALPSRARPPAPTEPPPERPNEILDSPR